MQCFLGECDTFVRNHKCSVSKCKGFLVERANVKFLTRMQYSCMKRQCFVTKSKVSCGKDIYIFIVIYRFVELANRSYKILLRQNPCKTFKYYSVQCLKCLKPQCKEILYLTYVHNLEVYNQAYKARYLLGYIENNQSIIKNA